MKITIEVDDRQKPIGISIDGVSWVMAKDTEATVTATLADYFDMHKGVTEYNGIVADIQKWYYGSLVKDSWCATSISYFANQMGILSDIGGKNENVFHMCNACRDKGGGVFFDKNSLPFTVKRGDILFYLWKGSVMGVTSSKHVGICHQDCALTTGGMVPTIGGNQSDSICVRNYDNKFLYAVYRPAYH